MGLSNIFPIPVSFSGDITSLLQQQQANLAQQMQLLSAAKDPACAFYGRSALPGFAGAGLTGPVGAPGGFLMPQMYFLPQQQQPQQQQPLQLFQGPGGLLADRAAGKDADSSSETNDSTDSDTDAASNAAAAANPRQQYCGNPPVIPFGFPSVNPAMGMLPPLSQQQVNAMHLSLLPAAPFASPPGRNPSADPADEQPFFVGEMAEVLLGNGQWLDVVVTSVSTVAGVCDVMTCPEPGALRLPENSRVPLSCLRRKLADLQVGNQPNLQAAPALVHTAQPSVSSTSRWASKKEADVPDTAGTARKAAKPKRQDEPSCELEESDDFSADNPQLIRVGFRYGRRAWVRCEEMDLNIGDKVIVAMGKQCRHCDLATVLELTATEPVGFTGGRRILRHATADEIPVDATLEQADEQALESIRALVKKMSVPIVVHAAEWQHSKTTLTIHYTSLVGKPDFRKLFPSAYKKFRCRIWMNNCDPTEGQPGDRLFVDQPHLFPLGSTGTGGTPAHPKRLPAGRGFPADEEEEQQI
ncbi:cell cycle sequence binding phosphoprotein (RBP33) [Diplonema papillatum]|nr:cell cycle sequence binding phosphoprotein (RBP33) [Diplonema papillatum]